jgi:hypothetical protein
MSLSKVVPISIIKKYLDNPGELTSYNEYYKCVDYEDKEGNDIKKDIRNILTNYDSDDDDDYDEFIPISVIKKYLDNTPMCGHYDEERDEYYYYDTTSKVLINNIKKLLRPEFDCSYCGRTTNCYDSIDCDYFKYDVYSSKLTREEQQEKQIEENHSGFGNIACADLFCGIYCADKHYELVHFQGEKIRGLSCVKCESSYNLLSCRCYHREVINIPTYGDDDYLKTIFCKDCINCDHCRPETCNKNALLGTEDVFDHAYRTGHKYKPNGELRKEGEKFRFGSFY